MTFDPARAEAILLGDCGYRFCLEDRLEDSSAVGGLGSSADAYVNMAVQCFLVGLDGPALQLLEKAHQWLEIAIADNERPTRYAADGTEALRFCTLAMCNWLLRAAHDDGSLLRYVTHKDRFLANSAAGRDKIELSLSLPTYVDAGAFTRVLEIFAAVPALSAPRSLQAIRSEAQMAYVLSRHHLGRDYEPDAVQAALGAFLTKNMDKWLADGHFLRAAEWLKIAYWNGNETPPSPKEVLLMCYTHMPGCQRIV